MIIIGGNSHPKLAQQIGHQMGQEVVMANTRNFADQELKVQINKDLYEQDVILLQSTTKPANDHLMELLLLADTAKRAVCRRIIAVIPYFGYSRQDRPSYEYGPISASLVARLIETSGIDRVITVDMHSKQAEGFFKIGVKNLDPTSLFVSAFPDPSHCTVVSPDIGGLPRAKGFAAKLGTDLAIINKSRRSDGAVVMSDVIGNVAHKDCILVDDIVDTGSTLYNARHLLMDRGARSVSACITHGVFSGEALLKIEQAQFDHFFITDTIYHPTLPSFIKSLPISSFIVDALAKCHHM